MNNNTTSDGFYRLYKIIKKLRSEDGCPWDREQTPESIKENIIEEAYECVDAIMENDTDHVCEELGDLYLLTTFETVMYEENNSFNINDVFNTICEKLIRRHPHVFSETEVNNSEEVIHQWEEIKDKVEGRAQDDSILDSVPKHFPPLLKALKLQKKAAKVNFDWSDLNQILNKLNEELNEFNDAVDSKNVVDIEEEIGDILFTVVNIARFLKIDPSTALTKTNNKFDKRFRYIEEQIKTKGGNIRETNIEALENLWQKAKKAKF